MKLRERFFNWAFAKEIAAVRARFEAAYWGGGRSYLPGFIQSASQDNDTLSRQEILRRVRYFEKNSETLGKALEVMGVNVIGTGIRPTPATGSESWNKAACEWWANWVEVADITGTASLYEMQDIVFRGELVDGDQGVETTFNEFGRPALNLIEGHRITSLGVDQQKLEIDGYRIVDGVIVGRQGKPLAYTVTDEFGGKGVAVIEASRLVLFFRKRRANQYRGMTAFHAGVMTLHDLDDLQRYEMRAAKDAASISRLVKTAAGAATVDGIGIGRSLTPATAQTGDRAEYYAKALGGEVKHLLPGDEVQQYKNDRPSAATSGFWDRLENKFVQGIGLSYAALCDYRGNWGGATLRAAVTSDNRMFALRTAEQARKWQRIWEFAIGWAMKAGELPFNADFRSVRWHPPRRTTVDIGHESDARLKELQGGLNTYEGIYGEAGDDWRERLRQRAIEEREISDLAEEFDIPRELIASFAQERVTVTAQGTDPEAGDGAGEQNSDPAGNPAKAKP